MLASAVDQAVLRTFVDCRFPRVGAALDDAGVPLAAVASIVGSLGVILLLRLPQLEHTP